MLLIWDFDGVIADTEHLATDAFIEIAKGLGIDITREEIINHIIGKGQGKQLEALLALGKNANAEIVRTINDKISEAVSKNICLTDNIEDIFKLKEFAQCVATGNSMVGIKARFEPLNLSKYFTENNTFSASFVKHGKPEPDLFLYAAEKMNYKPQECIVVEDSIYGIMAGLKANMTVVAYLEHILYDKKEYIEKIKSLGNVHFCNNMIELKEFLLNYKNRK